MMQKLLIPVEGTPISLRAVEWVIAQRARQPDPQGLEVHLVHVEPQLNRDVSRFFDREKIEAYRREQTDKALSGAVALLQAAGVPQVSHSAVGHIPEAVTALADKLGCEQIVMGVRGRSALAEFLSGAVVLEVVHLAKVPVLLVK
jgi:nucleotide-binding universal stress UspA family protein